ncbi:MAG: hypothetical protein ACJ71N_12865 [Terriglobales bacterium]|jgi:hypothetical protein
MKPKRSKAKKGSNIEKVPIAEPLARDEGPRLIPLPRKRSDEGHFQRILDLADILLKPKTKY